MVAPRFFTDDQHPGRRLVERVAERSFKHNDEFSVDFQAFFHPVRDAFAALNAMEDIEDAKPFEQALAQLEAGWAAQDVLDEEAHQQSMSAVRFAETRQAEADRIAWELSQRSDLVGVNSVVQDFLFGTWSLVMANARLANARKEIDPGGFVALVADLLWSVNQESTLRDPARAFEVIPRVLVGVRKGLDTVGNPPEASMAFMLELERLHRPVMKLRAKLRGPAGRAMLPEAPPAAAAAPVTAPQKGQLWLTPREQRAAGFEEAHSDHAPLAEENADAESLLAGLAEGSWVDMLSKDQWRRCRLAWASGNRAFYMFVSHGGQPHSMTRRTLHRMLRERHVRPVDGDAVVPRAMQQIKREAAQAQPARASVAAALA